MVLRRKDGRRPDHVDGLDDLRLDPGNTPPHSPENGPSSPFLMYLLLTLWRTLAFANSAFVGHRTNVVLLPPTKGPLLIPPQTIASLKAELKILQTQQDQMSALAVYIGMSKEEAARYDERRTRITEIGVAIAALGKIEPAL